MTPWAYQTDASIRNFAALVKHRMPAEAKVFISCDGLRTLTYGDYWRLSGQLACVLTASGVGAGDRVAIQAEKSIKAIALFLASARLGSVYLPLNPAYTSAELDYFISDAQPSVIVCTPENLTAMSILATKHRCPAVFTLDGQGGGSLAEAASLQGEEFSDAPAEWNDIAAILYTSGTTGRSKGAMLTHGNLASNALTLAHTWRFTSTDKLIHALPVHHTHGLFTAVNTVLLSGGKLLFRRRFDADDVLRLMPQATAMMGVPTYYTRLLGHGGLTRELTRHMRLFISGSAPLLAETHQRFFAVTGHAILERYGMTETNMNTSNPYRGARIPGSVGLPLPGVEIRIADGDGRPLPQGEIGMIEVRGPNVFKGYWKMPEKTQAEFRADGFFITGDLGTIGADGYLRIVGRGKDLIITGGLTVYPREIESLLDELPGVEESAVVGLPHDDFGEGVTAFLVLKPGAHLTQESVLENLGARLARFKIPKRVFFVEQLPRNSMGKVQKSALRQEYAALYQG